MTDRRADLAIASRTAWARFIGETGPLPALDREFLDRLLRERHECRLENGGGGCCHLVTEWLEHEAGLCRMAVSFLAPDGRVAVSGHYVSLAADGSILDATADQFGLGHDIRVLAADDPDYGLYRPEFSPEWNPDTEEWLSAWSDFPGREHGWDDFLAQQQLTARHGADWWLADPSERAAWLARDARDYDGRIWSGLSL